MLVVTLTCCKQPASQRESTAQFVEHALVLMTASSRGFKISQYAAHNATQCPLCKLSHHPGCIGDWIYNPLWISNPSIHKSLIYDGA